MFTQSVTSKLYHQSHAIQHKTLAGENFGRLGTARKLMEKILAADHTNNSSLFELTRTYSIWLIKLWWIANCPPNLLKFSLTEVLCSMVQIKCIVHPMCFGRKCI